MPWSRADPAKERLKFVLEWEERWQAGEGRVNLSQLCRELGIYRCGGSVSESGTTGSTR